MKVNVGLTDRIIRIVAGAGLLLWALFGGPWWAWIGIVPLATGLARRCPAYQIAGISTCATETTETPAKPA